MKFDDLILNENSRKSLANFAKNPIGALILSGKNGVGFGTIAKILAKKIAKKEIFLIEPTKNARQKTENINVDDTRKIVDLAKNSRKNPLVIVIDEAEKMSAEKAWQPLLKILEEPTKNLYFILTTHEISRIPSTILSRAQKIEILPAKFDFDEFSRKIAKNAAENSQKILKPSAQKKAQIEFLAENLPAETARLLENEEYFREKSAEFTEAKNFFSGKIAKRLEIVAKISERKNAQNLLKNLAKIALKTAKQNPENFAKNLELLDFAAENLAKNGNLKIQLMNLAANFR